MPREERRRRNGVTDENSKTKTIKELEAENADLQEQLTEAQDALIELADIIAGGE